MALDSGLSPRGIDNVDATLEKINAAVEERAKKQNNNIDLSTSENWLIRDELIQICKDAVQNNLAAKVRAADMAKRSPVTLRGGLVAMIAEAHSLL